MKEFDEILELANTLLGPEGCPWDRKQTFQSCRPFFIEESHEIIEAIDENDKEKIIEELGDLFYVIIFVSKIAEKEKLFSIEDVLLQIQEKLIRRHPHVFSDEKIEEYEAVISKWEKIKTEEKSHEKRESYYDGCPKTLPLLSRAQKLIKKAKRKNSKILSEIKNEDISDQLFNLILKAENEKMDIESSFRYKLNNIEKKLREEEKDTGD